MEFFLKGRSSWPVQILLWLFTLYIAWNMVGLGYGKLINPTELFGIPAWLMGVTGFFEVVSPLAMFVPRWSFYGALPVIVIMIVAIIVTGGAMLPIIVGTLAIIIAFIMRPSYLRKKPMITKVSV